MLWPSRAERIARRADSWVVRSEGVLTPQQRAERDSWRAADPRHEQAWVRASALWAATGAMVRPREETVPLATPSKAVRRGPRLAFAGIVAVIAASGVAVLLDRHPAQHTEIASEWTTEGQPRQLRLPDGTTVDLGLDSAIRSDMSGPVRAVLVERGTARFDVAHDARHPFVVSAADRKVTAIGTRFEIALRQGGVIVTLFQGAVEVDRRDPRSDRPPVRIKPGQRLTMQGEKQVLSTVSAAATPAETSVQDIDPTPVGTIVARANRTAAIPIRFADPALAARKVEGRFDTADTQALTEQLAAALDLFVTKSAGAYTLSSR